MRFCDAGFGTDLATEKQLRDVLIEICRLLERQQSDIVTLTAEVAALRESLIEIGPKYDEVLSRHRSLRAGTSKQEIARILREVDGMIQKLRQCP